ncbi:hypothetical protein [Larkinella rosea]|uniref:PD-(D/E)XK endonuclease-like domain-containing protein n=1 Tax=Larkinella rosea TaxID=2025312 RepID=A0A3P1BP69_9BACT|nr:hypothetical protein [Larkinella rosea]RRB02897.1 hypothetical protein EHT25_20895 [Larkinella rosea]
MSGLRLQVYPSLLNDWGKYQQGMIEVEDLLDRINRVIIPKTEAQLAGLDFEDALIRYAGGQTVEGYNAEILDEMTHYLPAYATTQQFVEFEHQGIRVYGKADVVGDGRVIDIKTTGHYAEPRYMMSYQNLYLYALRGQCTTMEYLITDFHRVYREVYHISSYNFTDLLHGVEDFARFCEENRSRISDPRIWGN